MVECLPIKQKDLCSALSSKNKKKEIRRKKEMVLSNDITGILSDMLRTHGICTVHDVVGPGD